MARVERLKAAVHRLDWDRLQRFCIVLQTDTPIRRGDPNLTKYLKYQGSMNF